MVKFDPKPRLDLTSDTRNSGDDVRASAAIDVTDRDTPIGWLVYGERVGGMGDGTSFVNEVLHGYREVKSGASGDVVRFQVGVVYSPFD